MPKAKIKPRKTVKKRGRPEEVRLKIAGDPAEAIAKFLAAKKRS